MVYLPHNDNYYVGTLSSDVMKLCISDIYGLLHCLHHSDVNKDLTFKDKDQTLKAKDQDKDQNYKDQDKD